MEAAAAKDTEVQAGAPAGLGRIGSVRRQPRVVMGRRGPRMSSVRGWVVRSLRGTSWTLGGSCLPPSHPARPLTATGRGRPRRKEDAVARAPRDGAKSRTAVGQAPATKVGSAPVGQIGRVRAGRLPEVTAGRGSTRQVCGRTRARSRSGAAGQRRWRIQPVVKQWRRSRGHMWSYSTATGSVTGAITVSTM